MRVVFLERSKITCTPMQMPSIGLPGAEDVVAEHAVEGELAQVRHRLARRADAGENHPFGRADFLRVVGDLGLMPEMPHRAQDARQVPGSIIHNRDHAHHLRTQFIRAASGAQRRGALVTSPHRRYNRLCVTGALCRFKEGKA